MTTIATDGRSIAGDSLTNGGGMVCRYAPKVFRAPNGALYGCSGRVVDCIKFQGWMTAGGEQPSLEECFQALILNADGTVDWMDKSFVPVRHVVPYAIGSGCEIAIGAMLAGAVPERAVVIAAQRDTCTGGDITELHLETSNG